jgi:MFS family permease
MLGPLAIGGVTVVLVGLTSNPFVAGGMFFVNGLMVGVFNVIGRSLRQVLTPDRLLGRVTSGFRVFSYGMASVGAVVGGAIAGAFGLRAPFFFGGVLMVGVTLVMGIWVNERAIAQARKHAGIL